MMIAGLAVGCSSKGNTNDGGGQGKDGSTTSNGIITNVVLESDGIDFGDWLYSSTLHKVVIPGANSGKLYLIDPQSLNITAVTGFAVPSVPDGGFHFNPPDGFMIPDGFRIPDGGFRGFLFGGLMSVAEANGLLYGVNTTDNMLYYIDPGSLAILGKVALAGDPGTIRYSSVTKELWVTERVGMGMTSMSQIEIFGFGPDSKTPVATTAKIALTSRGGDLYIDNTHSQAYVNGSGGGMGAPTPTLAISLTTRQITNGTGWISGCRPGGFAADEANNLLFIACSDNGAVSLNIANGTPVQHFQNASQPVSLGFNPTLRHLYVPGPSTFIITVASSGTLNVEGGVPTPYAQSRALADEYGNFWSQQQITGSVLRIKDGTGN